MNRSATIIIALYRLPRPRSSTYTNAGFPSISVVFSNPSSNRSGGKHVGLGRGALRGNVKPQAQDRPLVIDTPHATATVLGTQFILEANDHSSKLEVSKGIVEFESREHLRAWREHPRHAAAQQAGRERYYTEYSLQICEPLRESHFERDS